MYHIIVVFVYVGTFIDIHNTHDCTGSMYINVCNPSSTRLSTRLCTYIDFQRYTHYSPVFMCVYLCQFVSLHVGCMCRGGGGGGGGGGGVRVPVCQGEYVCVPCMSACELHVQGYYNLFPTMYIIVSLCCVSATVHV